MANETCPAPWKATSNGALSGDNPVHFALPLLTVQICLILFVSRVLALLLKPLRQPRVVAEIIGGILLGPSALGYVPGFTKNIFPPPSLTVLNTFASLGLIFFLFLVGLELDLRSLKRTGKEALSIAAAGITVPFAAGIGASFVLRAVLAPHAKLAPFLVFMGVAMSITAFPVLARILAERKLLTTDVGQMAMSAAAVNDVAAWILLALAIALSNTNKSPAVAAYVLLLGVGFVLIMFFAVKPIMNWIARQSQDNEPIREIFVVLTLCGVLVASFSTDVIGIHSIFGAFVFGLIIPKHGPFAQIIIEKIEDFNSILFLPLYFASSGLNTKLQSIHGGKSIGLVFMVIAFACCGKILGTLLAARLHHMIWKMSLVLGVLMNTKGLVELIVLNIGLQRKILTEEIFTIMVIMALVTTFMTTPLVMWLYEPARDPKPKLATKVEEVEVEKGVKDELRMLLCLHGMKNVPALVNLTEVTRGSSRKRPVRVYLLHLVEFSERSSTIMMVSPEFGKRVGLSGTRSRRAGATWLAFQAYAQLSRVAVRPMTAISGFGNMHEDFCTTANDKRVSLIILPYHKYQRMDGQLETIHPGFQGVNQKVLHHAPCSVGILVDRNFGGSAQLQPARVAKKVLVLFFGGPDDREALVIGRRMAEHPGVATHVTQFRASPASTVPLLRPPVRVERVVPAVATSEEKEDEPKITRGVHGSFVMPADEIELDHEQQMDELALSSLDDAISTERPSPAPGGLQKERDHESEPGSLVSFERRQVEAPIEEVLEIARSGAYDLIICGRGRRPGPLIAALAMSRTPSSRGAHFVDDTTGLGPIGDALTSRDIHSSVLIIQQHDPILEKMEASEARNEPSRNDP
eukprot:SM000175S03272  [mRNA]  locus=s175:68084:73087:+ [translate_table: standard]